MDIWTHRCRLFCHNQGIYIDEYTQALTVSCRSCRIETSPMICSANQWTSFYMIGTTLMKELRRC